jgi:hypothetical protein
VFVVLTRWWEATPKAARINALSAIVLTVQPSEIIKLGVTFVADDGKRLLWQLNRLGPPSKHARHGFIKSSKLSDTRFLGLQHLLILIQCIRTVYDFRFREAAFVSGRHVVSKAGDCLKQPLAFTDLHEKEICLSSAGLLPAFK